MSSGKIRNEDAASKLSLYQSTHQGIDRMRDNIGNKKRNFGHGGSLQRRYMEEWSEQARQTYANDSDCENSKNFYVQGMSTMHGSQWFQNQEGVKETMKNYEINNTENKGHSIGYYQPSSNNKLAYNGNIYISLII